MGYCHPWVAVLFDLAQIFTRKMQESQMASALDGAG
jgi:hypothetical protein